MLKLTDAGVTYAVRHAPESIVARVALAAHTGGPCDWPLSHQKAAVEAVNAQASESPATR